MAEWVAAIGTVGALLAAVWAIRLQVRELGLQREELALQRGELRRSIEMHELLAEVELARLRAQGEGTVADSLSLSFFRLEAVDGHQTISVQNRSNWRMTDVRVVLFGKTDRPESFVYQWPTDVTYLAYEEDLEFATVDESVVANASVTIPTNLSVQPLGTESLALDPIDHRFEARGYLVTFAAAGRIWLATNSGGMWGSQLAVHPIDVEGPYKIAEHCREHRTTLLNIRRD